MPTTTGFRARLHSDAVLLGALVSIPDASVAAILGRSGLDFVLLDAEHGPFTLTELRACVEALEPTPAATIVRPAANDSVLIKRILELGVDGIQVPSVGSAAEAAAAVRAARFAPEGNRGIGVGRASGYGGDIERYLREANAATAVIVMIEDGPGVEAAAEIAAVEGLDAIVIGPFDLSAALGVIGEPQHPAVVEAIGRVVEAAGSLAVGTVCAPDETRACAARGLRLLTIYVDVLALAASARSAVETARSA